METRREKSELPCSAPESDSFLEIAAELTNPAQWAAMMLTKVGRPGITQGEAMQQVEAIVQKAIALSQNA